jgi:hypothetical protein
MREAIVLFLVGFLGWSVLAAPIAPTGPDLEFDNYCSKKGFGESRMHRN